MKLKHLMLLLATCGSYTIAFAQPVIKTQKTIGGSADDFFSAMDLTSDGGAIIAGTSYSGISGEKTDPLIGPLGTPDFWIVKLNKTGKIQWQKTIGTADNDELSAIQQTKDGGYIVGGTNINKFHFSRYWIIKLDKAGNIQWNKMYNKYLEGEDRDVPSILHSLQQTRDGGYVAAGIAVGYYEYYSPAWVIKIDSVGNLQWESAAGGEELNAAIQQTKDNGYIVGSSSYDHSFGTSVYRVTKMNETGSVQWDKSYRGNPFETYDFLYAIAQTNDGGYLIGGSSTSNKGGVKSENSRGLDDYWILKIDSAGNVLWDKTIGGSSYDVLMSIKQLSDGYLLSGYSYSDKSGEKSENSKGNSDYWVVKLASDRKTVEWDKTIGGDSTDNLLRVKEISANRYLLGGYSYSGISGNKKQQSRGGADFWLVVLNYTNQTATSSSHIAENTISKKLSNQNFIAYPNPAKDILHIQTNGEATFTLTNQSGKILLTKTIMSKGEVNIAHLAAGLYHLKNNTTGEMKKVVVIK